MKQKLNQNIIQISIFCGGRGSSTIIREFLRRPKINLNLLVNAYDDGLSTGSLRKLVQGMLGPSDFRKNLSHLLEFYSKKQYALSSLMEFRLPKSVTTEEIHQIESYSKNQVSEKSLPLFLRGHFKKLDRGTCSALREYLSVFFSYYRSQERPFDFGDCSFGNLLFAGAFIKSGHRFNQAVLDLGNLLSSKSGLINVTPGDNRTLVALKANGELLECEAKIVEPQSQSPISHLFLLEHELSKPQIEHLSKLSLAEKKEMILRLEKTVPISSEANQCIAQSDIIIFGPGTQHSSLFPSYKTIGLREALNQSKAKIKVFLVNIAEDHDIRTWTATQIVDRALTYLGDPQNEGPSITHILYNRGSEKIDNGVRSGLGPSNPQNSQEAFFRYKNAYFIPEDLAHPTIQNAHCGEKVVNSVLRFYEEPRPDQREDLSIYVDLNIRSLATKHLLDELVDINWNKYFSHVKLVVNRGSLSEKEVLLPSNLSVELVDNTDRFSDVQFFSNWITTEKSAYLATITGDGEFRLRDIIAAVKLIQEGNCDVVYGSRSQSRRQLQNSIRSAYGESYFLYFLGSFASLCFSLFFWIRFRILFSDPLTGFRVYSRFRLRNLNPLFSKTPSPASSVASGLPRSPTLFLKSPSTITQLLIHNSFEIAEIPIHYTTFSGFTNMSWRVKRTLRSLLALFF